MSFAGSGSVMTELDRMVCVVFDRTDKYRDPSRIR